MIRVSFAVRYSVSMKLKAICALAIMAFLGNCQNKSRQPVTGETVSLRFSTDNRIETLYYVFLLSDYPLISSHHSQYISDAAVYFKKYESHEAVVLAKELVDKGFSFDYAVNWIFQYSAFPMFEKEAEVDFPFDSRPINADSLQLFHKALTRFYHDAGCESFFKAQKRFLHEMINQVETGYRNKNIIKVIEGYYGVKKEAEHHVILSPLLHNGGFAIERTLLYSKRKELYAVVGPSGIRDSLPLFDEVYLEQDMVIHEFSHNYANPVVEKYLRELAAVESRVYLPVKEKVREEGYATFQAFMYELIVRSTTFRIVENLYGEDRALELLEYEKTVGFGSVAEVAESLKRFEKQRKIYPTFEDYFPELIKDLKLAQLTDQ
jgi:hypothetical protein